MTLSRRSFMTGLVAVAAPAVIRTPGLLMPVRSMVASEPEHLMLCDVFDETIWRCAMQTAPDLLALMAKALADQRRVFGPLRFIIMSSDARRTFNRQIAHCSDTGKPSDVVSFRGVPIITVEDKA